MNSLYFPPLSECVCTPLPSQDLWEKVIVMLFSMCLIRWFTSHSQCVFKEVDFLVWRVTIVSSVPFSFFTVKVYVFPVLDDSGRSPYETL